MQIVFNLWNHNEIGRRSLEDVIAIMSHQMRALGHDAKWESTNKEWVGGDSGVNVVVEGFTPYSIAQMAAAKNNGARFIILATEEPTYTGDPSDRTKWVGFNQGTQKEMTMRMMTFPQAAALCEGILHLVPGEHVTRWCQQFAPAAQADLGYAPTLVRGFLAEPEFAFGFYGSWTKRRERICKKLARMINLERAVKLVVDFKTQAERDREMQRAKVIVQVRKFDEMGLVSSSRCNTALCLGRPVVAEPHDLSKPWDEVISFAKTLDGFYSLCLFMLQGWERHHREQMARFKNKMSPEICVGAPLRAIGIESPGGRIAA